MKKLKKEGEKILCPRCGYSPDGRSTPYVLEKKTEYIMMRVTKRQKDIIIHNASETGSQSVTEYLLRRGMSFFNRPKLVQPGTIIKRKEDWEKF